jgi:serine/tyrosine/threonine adenylyltransferase
MPNTLHTQPTPHSADQTAPLPLSADQPTPHALPAAFTTRPSYADLPPAFHSACAPVPVAQPSLLLYNDALDAALGLHLAQHSQEARGQLLSGNALPISGAPLAQAYAGHQFGHFAVLGDGRAHLLGEGRTADGRLFDIALKGSGRTPYSRGGDGRAALKPMLREYLISEAMAGLGIASTRSLAVIVTGEQVLREEALPGAILVRVAHSHIRVGTFAYAAALQDKAALEALTHYTLARHMPDGLAAANPALTLLRHAIKVQAKLVAQWMSVGFVHGVMNTDNMTLSGETIDYGPCAFMDAYDPACVFSSIDRQGRYAYGNQPRIAQWNLARLAQALLPLLDADAEAAAVVAQAAVDDFPALYQAAYMAAICQKLGFDYDPAQPQDGALVAQLLAALGQDAADYTLAFHALAAALREEAPPSPAPPSPPTTPALKQFTAAWQAHLHAKGVTQEAALARMAQHNPLIIPRNHVVEAVLEEAQAGDMAAFQLLVNAVRTPFAQPDVPSAWLEAPPPNPHYRTFCGT